MHHPDSAGSCRGLSGQPPGWPWPLYDPHEAHYDYAKRYPISPAYPWRIYPLLSLSSSPKSVLVLLLVVGCVGCYWHQGMECNLGITLYIFIKYQGVSFCYYLVSNVLSFSQVRLEWFPFCFLYREMFYCSVKLICNNFPFYRSVLLFSQVRLEQIIKLYVFYYKLVY